jgi:undecaprenyl-diphosphatase
MDSIQIITLALLQGLTEFLPISSSAHLILVPVLTSWQDQGLAFDVAVHVGTLAAVVLYFRHELVTMAKAWLGSLLGRGMTLDGRLAWAVLFGTIPAGVVGFLAKDWIELYLRSPLVIAVATIGFAVLLGGADAWGRQNRDEYRITWLDIGIIGLSQALAIIPGTSRSGVTMTAGLALGLSRQAAARFSFLLSIPVIVLAGGLLTLDLIQQPQDVHWNTLLIGTVIAALSAYLCIHYFLKWLQRISMLPFVIYRLVLGIGLLIIFI